MALAAEGEYPNFSWKNALKKIKNDYELHFDVTTTYVALQKMAICLQFREFSWNETHNSIFAFLMYNEYNYESALIRWF